MHAIQDFPQHNHYINLNKKYHKCKSISQCDVLSCLCTRPHASTELHKILLLLGSLVLLISGYICTGFLDFPHNTPIAGFFTGVTTDIGLNFTITARKILTRVSVSSVQCQYKFRVHSTCKVSNSETFQGHWQFSSTKLSMKSQILHLVHQNLDCNVTQ